MATVTLNNLWNFIQSMSLSANNELWLAEKLHITLWQGAKIEMALAPLALAIVS